MDVEELRERLTNIEVNVSAKTLRRWADDALITNHREHPENIAKTGRGNAEDWPPEAVEEAAAVWAVKEAAEKRLTPKEISDIQMIGVRTFYTPQAYYAWSHDVPLTGPIPLDRFPRKGYDHRVLRIEFRDDHPVTLFLRLVELRAGGEPHPGEERLIKMLEDEHVAAAADYFIHCDGPVLEAPITVMDRLTELRVDVPSRLVRTWVTAFVKAASGVEVTASKKVVFYWRSLHGDAGSSFMFEKVVLEEPDLRDLTYVQTRESIFVPIEPPREDEIVIYVDGIDVRKKVFYAPFDEWKSLTPLEP
ncbi:MAG: hypothetical protein WBZ42_10840 [Halobacteriota archaeon]